MEFSPSEISLAGVGLGSMGLWFGYVKCTVTNVKTQKNSTKCNAINAHADGRNESFGCKVYYLITKDPVSISTMRVALEEV